MKELISVAVLIASVYGGTIVGERIFDSIRQAALTKAAHGLPRLSTLSQSLTSRKPRVQPTRPRPRKEPIHGSQYTGGAD